MGCGSARMDVGTGCTVVGGGGTVFAALVSVSERIAPTPSACDRVTPELDGFGAAGADSPYMNSMFST